MLHRKNKNLRLVRELEESVDKLADEIMTELNSEGNSVEELEVQVREQRLRFRRRTVINCSRGSNCCRGIVPVSESSDIYESASI